MSGASWQPDPALTREKHKWVFAYAERTDWGACVSFYCGNPGCPTTLTIPCKPDDDSLWGICFDRARAVQLTDRDGTPIL